MALVILLSIICVIVASWCKAKCDRMVMNFINLPYINQQTVRPNWFCFNPLAKYNNGKYGTGYKTWKIPFTDRRTSFLVSNFSDGWHFLNSLGICALLIPAALFIMLAVGHFTILSFIIVYVILGLLWNEIFAFSFAKK